MDFVSNVWQRKVDSKPEDIKNITKELNVSKLFAEVCFQRGLTSSDEISSFIQIDESWFHDPFLLYDMGKSINRIMHAVENNEKITIYGDYDADGITSTALLYETLDSIGANVDYYLPNRFKEGYGPNLSAFKKIIEKGTNLIITVDNGVTGHEAIDYANSQSVNVIITDHHQLPEELPNAYSIIHPAHPKGNYPFKELAGVGVALKVATALTNEISSEALELAAIGTVADLVSLTGENRAIVYFGIKMLQETQRIGILQLIKIMDIDLGTIDEDTIGFQIAPRLNSLGRLDDAEPGVELLCTYDINRAEELADFIDKQNEKRKIIVEEMTKQVLEEVAEIKDKKNIIVLSNKNWHQGVLGIVASRIVEEANVPTLLFSVDSKTNIAKGSGRSVEGINLYNVLADSSDYFIQYGGHEMAAGMSINNKKINEVKNKMSDYIEKNATTDNIRYIDAFISINDLSLDELEELNKLKPFGVNNTKPLVASEDVKVINKSPVGVDGAHLKMTVEQNNKKMDIISFRNGFLNEFLHEQQNISIAGYLELNVWNGITKIQMNMQDIHLPNLKLIDQRKNKLVKQDFDQDNSLYVFYNKVTYNKFKDNIVETSDAILVLNKNDTKNIIPKANVVIVDCPNSIELFKYTLDKTIESPIICYFYKKEHFYLSGLPNRNEFAKVYKYLANYKNIDLKNKGHFLINELNMDSHKMFLIIQVFLEAKFVTINNGLINMENEPNKINLAETKHMQFAEEQIKAEKLFLYSSFNEIISEMNTKI